MPKNYKSLAEKRRYEAKYAKRLNPSCEDCGTKISKLYSRNGKMLCKKCDKLEAERVVRVPDDNDEYMIALKKHILG